MQNYQDTTCRSTCHGVNESKVYSKRYAQSIKHVYGSNILVQKSHNYLYTTPNEFKLKLIYSKNINLHIYQHAIAENNKKQKDQKMMTERKKGLIFTSRKLGGGLLGLPIPKTFNSHRETKNARKQWSKGWRKWRNEESGSGLEKRGKTR